MNYSTIVGLTSGVLQFGVACYALRLNRFLDKARLGWVLFSAFSLLAVLHLLLPVNPFRGSSELGLMSEVIFGLFSLLLLVGMAHLESRFKKRLQADSVHERELTQWETQIQAHADEVAKANEGLVQANSELSKAKEELTQANAALTQTNQELTRDLQYSTKAKDELALQLEDARQARGQVEAELAECKRAQEIVDAKMLEVCRTNEELQQTIAELQAQIAQQKEAREEAERAYQNLLATSRTAGSSVRHTLKSLHVSVNLITDHLAHSNLSSVLQAAKLMRSQPRDHGYQMRRDPRTKRLPDCLAQLARHLAEEKSLLLKKMDAVRRNLDQAQGVIATQQTFSGWLSEPEKGADTTAVADPSAPPVDQAEQAAPPAPPAYDLQDGQTHTATDVVEIPAEPAPPPAEAEAEPPIAAETQAITIG